MDIKCKYEFGAHVRQKYSEFQGFVIGVLIRPSYTEYEILPVTDGDANYRPPVWIEENLLEVI